MAAQPSPRREFRSSGQPGLAKTAATRVLVPKAIIAKPSSEKTPVLRSRTDSIQQAKTNNENPSIKSPRCDRTIPRPQKRIPSPTATYQNVMNCTADPRVPTRQRRPLARPRSSCPNSVHGRRLVGAIAARQIGDGQFVAFGRPGPMRAAPPFDVRVATGEPKR